MFNFNISRIDPYNFLLASLFVLSIMASKGVFVSMGRVEIGFYFLFLFFWGIRSEGILGPMLVFLFGLIQDALTGSALGTWPLVFSLFFALSSSQKQIIRQAKGGAFVFIFLILVGISYGLMLIICVLFYRGEADLWGLFLSFSLTAMSIPFLGLLMQRVLSIDGDKREGL
ncbi:rod shape-determining protein MreD [Alphaproteobacteria bacterium]|nr:rod shape-determining protein MreD [Alphaproteobacteria bacterium]